MHRSTQVSRSWLKVAPLLAPCLALILMASRVDSARAEPNQVHERVFEKTFHSSKVYSDPFNEVDVDVIFSRQGQSWRVPCFWRGGQQWTVRFAPPTPGVYSYRLESTDARNPDLNGHAGTAEIVAYRGSNTLLQRGALRVSANKRYIEHADGTPFYWLGDTWWAGLSDRLSWDGFRKLTADRKAKGFTLVQIVAGLVPLEEAPSEAGFCNEGGCVWSPGFERINPNYFDAADRRIQWLVDNDIVPMIVGGWTFVLPKMGVPKMQKHWRYLIARYGAYPVMWSVGGEVLDPPERVVPLIPEPWRAMLVPGWTEVTRYVRANDPYRHPLTAHELPPPLDVPLRDESLTDFDLLQSGQFGWPSIAFSVAQLNARYARTAVTKPVVQGEIGYENHYSRHFEDFQRTAFWLSMLNGAAGHTYGAEATWGAYSADKPAPRKQLLTVLNWEEGMNLPGSYQVGLGSKLLRHYPWWRFEPHPEWVTPTGTTFLDANDPSDAKRNEWMSWWLKDSDLGYVEIKVPSEETARRVGSFDRPYAAGIPGEVRIVYMPLRRDVLMSAAPPPTVLGLEAGICYAAYLWEPQLGIRFDLGAVQRPHDASPIIYDDFSGRKARAWTRVRGTFALSEQTMTAAEEMIATVSAVHEKDVRVDVGAQPDAYASIVLRYRDADNFVAAVYSGADRAISLLERRKGASGRVLARTSAPSLSGAIRLSAELRQEMGVVSVSDGTHRYTTPIVQLTHLDSGSVGLMYVKEGTAPAEQRFDELTVRRSAALPEDGPLPLKHYDASGRYRGEMSDKDGWAASRRKKHILLDAYRPDRLPTHGDWLLVLDATERPNEVCDRVLTSAR